MNSLNNFTAKTIENINEKLLKLNIDSNDVINVETIKNNNYVPVSNMSSVDIEQPKYRIWYKFDKKPIWWEECKRIYHSHHMGAKVKATAYLYIYVKDEGFCLNAAHQCILHAIECEWDYTLFVIEGKKRFPYELIKDAIK